MLILAHHHDEEWTPVDLTCEVVDGDGCWTEVCINEDESLSVVDPLLDSGEMEFTCDTYADEYINRAISWALAGSGDRRISIQRW